MINKLKSYLRRQMHQGGLILLISFIAALFVAGESLPWLKYPLYILLAAGLVLVVLFFSLNIIRVRAKIRGTIGIYIPLILSFIIFLLAVRYSSLPSRNFMPEFFNMCVVILIVTLHLLVISNKEQLLKHRNQFFRILFYLVTLISLGGLSKFFFYLRGADISPYFPDNPLTLGTSLVSNADIYIIALVAAMTGVILFKFRQKCSLILTVIYHLSFLIMFYTIIWSGSRKGLLLMIALVVVLVAARIYFLFHPSRVYNYNLIRNLNILLLVLGFSALIGTWALNMVPGQKKEEWISALGFDRYHFKSEITLITFEHISVFNPDANLQAWYDNLWEQNTRKEEAMQDKISFVLTEEENISTAPEKNPWAETAISNRRENWQKTMDIFMEYPVNRKIFGKGFNYLNQFNSLPPDKYDRDNFLLRNNYVVSALMYSGISGFIVLLLLMLQVFRIYFINRKQLLALLTLFIVIATLSLLFHNTILSSPLLLVSLIIPLRYQNV